ncbi:MAG: DUF6544 family protein [Acidimicrobiales bacterium]
MRTVVRWVVVAVVVVHGLIHLLGAAKGLGWAEVDQLSEPIGTAMGIGWLAAAASVVAAGLLLAARIRWWWAIGAVALVVSQAVIVTSWSDAAAGTAANLVLLAAVVHGIASQGPTSSRAEYRRQVTSTLATSPPAGTAVTEADLEGLPEPVAAHLRRCGVVGRPRVSNFRARIRGRIRAGADEPWMAFAGEQVNTFGSEPTRVFFIDATMKGLPVDVLHTFVGPSARMRVRVASLLTMTDAAGPEMDRAETVTILNDMCLFAPATLLDASVAWGPVEAHRVTATFTRASQVVSADLVFDDDHDLVDFVSDDRYAVSRDGKEFTPQRWSTPVRAHADLGSGRVATVGEGRWHAPAPEGEFTYIELVVDDLVHNVGHQDSA